MGRRARSGFRFRWVLLGMALTVAVYAWARLGPERTGEPGTTILPGVGAAPATPGAAARAAPEAPAGGLGKVASGRRGPRAGRAGGPSPQPRAGTAASGEAGAGAAGMTSETPEAGETGTRVASRDPLLGSGGAAAGAESGEPSATTEGESSGKTGEAPDQSAGDSADLVSLEESAARAAEALHLLTPEQLEVKVQQRLRVIQPDPSEMDQARTDARRTVLADAALVEDLVRQRYPDATQQREAQQARNWLETLMPAWGPDYRARKLEGVAQRLQP